VDFVGVVDLVAELHLDGATIIHRQPIRIEWIATSPAVASQVPSTTPVPEALPALQQPDHYEIALEGNKKAEQDGERTHQKRMASKVAVLIPRKGPTKPSTRRRAPNKPVSALPAQLTRASWSGW
jgi:hypothetical protein